jgi:hypothetical protein
MPTNEFEKPAYEGATTSASHRGAFAAITVALVFALGANIFLWARSSRLSSEIAEMRETTSAQIAAANAANNVSAEEYKKRLEAVTATLASTNESAAAALKRARADAQRQADQLNKKLEEQHTKFSGDLTAIQDTTNSKFSEVATNVEGVKGDVGNVKTDVDKVREQVNTQNSELEAHTAELKRVLGDMGVMSGLIATNGKDIESLRALGDRNYYEFTLNKKQKNMKVGNVVLTLKNADAKRNRYTLEVLADDKRVEKRDRTINEPVQVYVAGSRQPNEIVINQVNKDQVVGYLATPKMQVSRR